GFERAHHVARAEWLDAVEELVAPVEELLRFLRARRLGGRAHQYGKQPPRAALGGGDQAITRRFGMPGLHAVDRGIEPQQAVAVGLRDVVVAEFLDRVVP